MVATVPNTRFTIKIGILDSQPQAKFTDYSKDKTSGVAIYII